MAKAKKTTRKPKEDLEGLADELQDTLATELADVVQGTAEDLKTWAGKLAKQMLRAVVGNEKRAQKWLKEQARLLAEVQRVRFSKSTWRVVDKIIEVALKALDIGLRLI